jgi:hypothetical protein
LMGGLVHRIIAEVSGCWIIFWKDRWFPVRSLQAISLLLEIVQNAFLIRACKSLTHALQYVSSDSETRVLELLEERLEVRKCGLLTIWKAHSFPLSSDCANLVVELEV